MRFITYNVLCLLLLLFACNMSVQVVPAICFWAPANAAYAQCVKWLLTAVSNNKYMCRSTLALLPLFLLLCAQVCLLSLSLPYIAFSLSPTLPTLSVLPSSPQSSAGICYWNLSHGGLNLMTVKLFAYKVHALTLVQCTEYAQLAVAL